jgi:dolichol-phosphate mannosyltransferase
MPGEISKSAPAPAVSESAPLLLSVVIPAHDEEQSLGPTVDELAQTLAAEGIAFEMVLVNDNSSDDTQRAAEALAAAHPEVRVVSRKRLPGFGRAVRAGLAISRGDAVAIVMADRSDDPRDVVRYYRKLEEGYDCVFGSRFRRGSRVVGYPRGKLVVNRIVNKAIQLLFWTRFNDLTNAFKAYRRHVILECGPYSSSHFNLTIEMSLSALIRRYHIAEIPVNWYGRTWGSSHLSVYQMGRRYLSVLLKLFFERMLIGDDILEERLVERSAGADRMRALEERVAKLETVLERSGPGAEAERAPWGPGR